MTVERTGERRVENLGAPPTGERRSLKDRRTQSNLLYSSFRIGDTTFILNIHQVQEVLQAQEMVTVPLSSGLVAGLINLRGEIVPAVNLRPVLGIHDALKETDNMNVVIYSPVGIFSLIVDEVHDILEVSPSMIQATPPSLPGYLKALTNGICKLSSSLLMVLDIDGVVRMIESHNQA